MELVDTNQRADARVARAAASLLDRLYGAVTATRFPRVHDADAMLGFLGYVRIAVGLVALVRTGLILEASRFYYDGGDSWTGLVNAHETELALIQAGLLVLFTIGLFTPVATAALLVTYPLMDRSLATETLGTCMLSLLLIVVFLANGGARVSVDALLGRRVRALYVLGAPDARQLTVYLFGMFVGYGLISFGALLHHLGDAYWQGGDTVAVLFTSSYLSRFWVPARELQETWPWLLDAFSRVAVVGQTIFQLGMLVLVRWRWGLYYVIAWGVTFLLVSTVVLQLSYLPFLELLVWALLWIRPYATPAAEVLYDDRCNLCRGTVRVLRAVDPLRTFRFLPLSQHLDVAARHGASADDVLENLHGIRKGRLLRAYDLYCALARANPLLWPLVPVLELGRLTHVGPLAYGVVARRRRRLFGTCELGGGPEPAAVVPVGRQPATVSAVASVLLSVVALSLVMTFAEWQGFWRSVGLRPWPARVETWGNDIRFVLGLIPPDVFNNLDLQIGDHWWTATWETPDGRRGTVPFNEPDGSRGPYHRSDAVYFGNSVRWRRGTIGSDLAAANAAGTPLRELIERVLRYHRRRTRGAGPYRYEVRLFTASAADLTLPPDTRYAVHPAGAFTVEIP